jgi:predicted dehydrogenase
VDSVFAALETFHKTRLRPDGPVQTFANADPARMTRYEVDTEDLAAVLLRFDNGVHANAAVSQVAAGWKCSLYVGIYGTQGSLQWDLQQPNEILLGRRDEPSQMLQRGSAGFLEDVAHYTDCPAGHPEGFPDSHKMHCRAVYEHIAAGGTGPVLFATAADGHREVELCDAILASSESERWVKVR